MEQKQIIKTKKELLEVIASYDWSYYNPATQLFLVGDCYYDGSFNSSSVNEFEVDGKALNFLIKRDEEFVLKKQIIKTIEEVDDLTYLYDTYYFDLDSKTFRAADFVEDSEGKCYPDHWLEFSVEGEAFKFLVKREEDEILARVERARKEAIVPKEEKEAQALKEKNGGWFIFRAFFMGFWFYYEFEAKSLADAERIGWKSLAKETAHRKGDWKGGRVTKRKVRVWFCE